MALGPTAGIIASGAAVIIAVLADPLIASHGRAVYMGLSAAGCLVAGIVLGLILTTNFVALAVAFVIAGLIVPFVYLVWRGRDVKKHE